MSVLSLKLAVIDEFCKRIKKRDLDHKIFFEEILNFRSFNKDIKYKRFFTDSKTKKVLCTDLLVKREFIFEYDKDKAVIFIGRQIYYLKFHRKFYKTKPDEYWSYTYTNEFNEYVLKLVYRQPELYDKISDHMDEFKQSDVYYNILKRTTAYL